MADMIRPDLYDILHRTAGCYVACSCGHTLQTIEEIGEHWRRGHFDQAVTPEVIRAAVAAEREACAKVVAGWYPALGVKNPHDDSLEPDIEAIVAAIRARTEL